MKFEKILKELLMIISQAVKKEELSRPNLIVVNSIFVCPQSFTLQ